MGSQRIRTIEEAFHRALDLPPEKRLAFLNEACGDDTHLKDEVLRLLDCESASQDFLETPVIGFSAVDGFFPLPTSSGGNTLVGTHLGNQEIFELLAVGGMGEVYRARDRNLGRPSAVKVLPAAMSKDENKVRRFRREARAAASLRHPGVAQIYEYGKEGDLHFIVMEFVEGKTLGACLEEGPLPLATVTSIAQQILDALDAAHRLHIVHRDLKPSNLMLTPGGTVKILDFGLAKIDRKHSPLEASAASLTTTGMVMGTVSYMSPEQVLGKPVDARTDLFSFGVLCYQMITGRLPFAGKSIVETFDRICREQPVPLTRFCPEAPEALVRLVTGCLAKAPDRRFASAQDAARVLAGIRRNPLQSWLDRILGRN